jgi:hypothetical protein
MGQSLQFQLMGQAYRTRKLLSKENTQFLTVLMQVSGRVIVDPFGARKYMNVEDEEVDYFDDADDMEDLTHAEKFDIVDEPAKKLPRIKTRERRPITEEQKRNREFLLANTQYFITMNPMVEAYCLTMNEWRKRP